LLSSVLILRAIRQPTKLNWGLYSVTLLAGIYSHLLMGLVIIAHGIYVLIVERFRLTKVLWGYLTAALVVFALMLPWLGLVWQNYRTVSATTEHFTRPLPLSRLAYFWGLSFDRIFVAWHMNYDSILVGLALPLLVLTIYGFYYFVRHSPRPSWLFVFTLLGTMVFPFLIADLVLGGRRSTADRFFLICYICIDIIIAFLLASKLSRSRHRTVQDYLWRSITALLLLGGILSGLAGVAAPTWWGWSEFDVQIAKITNSVAQPLIISDVAWSGLAPFSHEVKPETRFILLTDPAALELPDSSNAFLYNPSQRLLSTVAQQKLDPVLVYQFNDPTSKLEISLY
jgi:uncharacterized membrane protein